MSRRIEVLVLTIIAVACGLLFWHFIDHDVIPAVRYGSEGPNAVAIDGAGWLKILAAALGTGGFSIASAVTIWKNFSQLLPAGNPFRKWGGIGVDSAQIAIYANAYRGAKSQAERDQIKAAMKLAADSMVEELCQDQGVTA